MVGKKRVARVKQYESVFVHLDRRYIAKWSSFSIVVLGHNIVDGLLVLILIQWFVSADVQGESGEVLRSNSAAGVLD